VRNKAVAAALGTLVIAALTWLWQKTQSLDPEDHARIDSALRELRSLDRTINQDVLRARYQLVDSYAPVLRSYRRVEELEAVIATPPHYLDREASAKLAAAVKEYRAAVTSKQGLIEAFKYRSADLMELLAYLPGAGAGIAAAARDSGDLPLAESAEQVLQLALLYNLTSDEKQALALRERTEALAAAGEKARAYRVKRRIGTLVLNIRRLLQVKPAVDRLLRRIFDEPVVVHEERVAATYYAGYAHAEHVARRCRGVLYGLSIALLTLVGVAMRRLRQTARALAGSNERLEERVAARTRELDTRNLELDASLTELRETQGRLLHSAKALADVSRQAGMAEIATGVLHNVGNALNSVNVSSEMLEARLRASKIGGVARVAEMLAAHADDLGGFLTRDPQGAAVPAYLSRLGGNLAQEREGMASEVRALQRHVEHIKRIVSKQQDFAKAMGLTEPCLVDQLVDDAVVLGGDMLAQLEVEVVRDYQALPEVLLDRHKVLQILVNLVSNARHALASAEPPQRRLTARIGRSPGERLQIEIADNGVGIAEQDMPRIFTHGFTTKKHGHGFGLHASALAAKEMGGALTCKSGGRGAGAAFVLDLPLRPVGSDAPLPHQDRAVAVDVK
jgi:signal transduction histidine kinase